MKFYTFIFLLAAFYSVAANSHLPEDPGFLPPTSLGDTASPVEGPVISDISLATTALPTGLDLQSAVSNSNNREYERNNIYTQISQLCALLRNCNPVQYGNPPLNYNSVPATNSYSAPLAPTVAMGYATNALPAPTLAPMPGYAASAPLSLMPAIGNAAPAPSAPLAPTSAPMLGYAAPGSPTLMSAVGYAANALPAPTRTPPALMSAMGYAAPTPAPMLGYAAPAPPAPVAPISNMSNAAPATIPAMGYASPVAPTSYTAIPTPAPMGYTVPTVRYPASGQTSYNAPTLPAQMSYPTTTSRPVVLGNYYIPASSVAPASPMAYLATTMRPSVPVYGAPMPAAIAPYSATTMRPPAPTSYLAPAPPMTPPRPYPIAVSSG